MGIGQVEINGGKINHHFYHIYRISNVECKMSSILVKSRATTINSRTYFCWKYKCEWIVTFLTNIRGFFGFFCKNDASNKRKIEFFIFLVQASNNMALIA